MIRYLIFIVISISSFNAFSAECPFIGKSGYHVYYDSEFAKHLESSVEELTTELRKINVLTFENRTDLPAITAVSLMEEVNETLETMFNIRRLTDKILAKSKCNENPDTLNEWVTIARNLARVSGYIDDLEHFRLINTKDKCFVCELITLRLSQVFDFIEARISNESVIF